MREEGAKDISKWGVGCKTLSSRRMMTLLEEEAPANFVPAAAVIREGRALPGLIGRKGSVGGILYAFGKRQGLNSWNALRTDILEYSRG